MPWRTRSTIAIAQVRRRFVYDEISLKLGVTPSSVQSRLHRARKLLRQQLVQAEVIDSRQ